jgi:SAM-dependent methyltransferase
MQNQFAQCEGEPQKYWDKRLKLHKGLCGAGYLGLGVNYNRWLYRIRWHVFLRYLKLLEIDFSKARALDVGSGSGFYLKLWRDKGVRSLVGSDFSDYALKDLESIYQDIRLIKLDISMDLEKQNFFNEKFDIISAFDVLFHIVDDAAYDKAFKNIGQLLSNNGYFIFSENFAYKNIITGHQHNRETDRIKRVLAENKFSIIKKAPAFVIMNSPVNTRSIFWKFIWKIMEKVIRTNELAGWFIGAVLFPIELLLLKVCNNSYSSSIVICQKKS